MSNRIRGRLVDILNREIYPAVVSISEGKITLVERVAEAPDLFILPGFIDAHIHIESSMVVPYEFAKVALTHGSIATVSDPHEIANVCGLEGIRYMINNAKEAKLKFHFGAPSCVPATSFETAGASIDAQSVRELLALDDIYYLSEMMNYPGVLYDDVEVLKKIEFAKEANKPIDGHAPGLTGDDAIRYINAGISTDHECFTLKEAQFKLEHGMKILIREGSAAKNYDALHPLIASYSDKLMFCSDDKHPDDLMVGHINLLVKRSLELGYDLFDVLRIACINPIDHYNMDVGQLRVGDAADFIIVKDLKSFDIISTYLDGERVYHEDSVALESKKHKILNEFHVKKKKVEDFVSPISSPTIPVIVAIDGEIVTEVEWARASELSNPNSGIQKICVINRYSDAPVSVGYIRNFGLKNGAIASTVAHDSHNIIVVGADDEALCTAVNLLIKSKGGLCVISDDQELHLPLPIAGLMSDQSCEVIAKQYEELAALAKDLGCCLAAPFMTLSFMALLVIPKLKISDLGMFDAEKFEFI